MLTGRGVRIVLPDVCAHRRVPNEGDGGGGGGGGGGGEICRNALRSHGPLHGKQCLLPIPAVCVCLYVCAPPPPGVTETCVTRQNPMRPCYIYCRGKNRKRRNTKKKRTHELFGDLHTCRPAVGARCLQRLQPTRSHPRSPDTAA